MREGTVEWRGRLAQWRHIRPPWPWHTLKHTDTTTTDRQHSLTVITHKCDQCRSPVDPQFDPYWPHVTCTDPWPGLTSMRCNGEADVCFPCQTKAQVVPNQGVWDMRGKQLYQGIQIRVWAIACFAPQRTVGEESLRYVTMVTDVRALVCASLCCQLSATFGQIFVAVLLKPLKSS